MSTRKPRASSEAELDALERTCDRLAGFDPGIVTEYVDGFLTALVVGPVRPAPEAWLQALCDDAFDRAFADPADRAQALAALHSRIETIEDALDPEALEQWPDERRLEPLMGEVTDEDRKRMADEMGADPADAAMLRTGVFWAEGFLAADAAFGPDWGVPSVQDDEFSPYLELTAQVNALLLAPDSQDERDFARVFYPDGMPSRDELLAEALFSVQALRLWWLEHAPRPASRRVAPAPGRNDPCPCGSGKKYKKCHGAVGV